MTTTTEQRITPASPTVQIKQFTPAGIFGTWAAAAVPMALLAWVIGPWLAHRFTGPTALPRGLILALTVGLAWQFVVVMFLVYREQRSLRWRVLKDALWLHAPQRPSTGRRGGKEEARRELFRLLEVVLEDLSDAVPGERDDALIRLAH